MCTILSSFHLITSPAPPGLWQVPRLTIPNTNLPTANTTKKIVPARLTLLALGQWFHHSVQPQNLVPGFLRYMYIYFI